MALVDICIYPDPVLRKLAQPVDQVDRSIRKMVDNMAETMYAAPGIGLAANQIGVPLRLLIIDLQKEDYQHGLLTLINPKIIEAEGCITFEEGCLSVPEYFANVKRHEQITVRALDVDGKPFELKASGLLAVVIQHEIDHLSGRLFIDHINPIKRDIFKRKWKKKQKQQADQA
jgi:peptide deformylase